MPFPVSDTFHIQFNRPESGRCWPEGHVCYRFPVLAVLIVAAAVAWAVSFPAWAFFFITMVSPENNAVGIDLETNPSVTFNKAIDPESAKGKFYLVISDGIVPGEIRFDYTSRTLQFIPDRREHLKFETTYQVVLLRTIKSEDGENLDADRFWTFRTEAPVTPMKDFYVYPNPCRADRVRLHFQFARDPLWGAVDLMDDDGRKIWTANLYPSKGLNDTEIALEDGAGMELENGLYRVRIRIATFEGGEIRSSARLVKAR